jgi:hypothetical protein
MADVKGVNKTIQDAVTPATLLENEVVGAKVRAIYEEYTLAASAAGTVIYLPELPLGAMIVDWKIDHAALGSSVTLAFGTVASAACLMAAAASASADKKSQEADGVAQALGYRCDSDTSGAEKTKPIITTAGATGTGKIKVMIQYTTKS